MSRYEKVLITCFLIVASVSLFAEPLSFYSLDPNKARTKFGFEAMTVHTVWFMYSCL